jgi:hypothetical protein
VQKADITLCGTFLAPDMTMSTVSLGGRSVNRTRSSSDCWDGNTNPVLTASYQRNVSPETATDALTNSNELWVLTVVTLRTTRNNEGKAFMENCKRLTRAINQINV